MRLRGVGEDAVYSADNRVIAAVADLTARIGRALLGRCPQSLARVPDLTISRARIGRALLGRCP